MELIIPSIFPETAKSTSPSFTLLISTVISSIDGMSLWLWEGSMCEFEPILIVGLPLRSDFTYALIILIRSPGFNSSISGRLAFSSQSFTLAVESLS